MDRVRHSIAAEPRGQILYLGAPIRLDSRKVLTGCNVYHHTTVLQQRIDFTTLANVTSAAAGTDFAPQFLARFRDSKAFASIHGLGDDFVERLLSPTGVEFPQVLLSAVIAVENALAAAMGSDRAITFSTVEGESSHRNLIWESAVPKLSASAAEVALAGVLDLLPGRLYPHPPKAMRPFAEAWRELEQLAYTLPPTTRAASQGSIPTVAVVGDHGTGAMARALEAILRGAGRRVALALRMRAYVNGEPADLTPDQQTRAPLILLEEQHIETLVTTVSSRHTATRGLLFDQCKVTVIADKAKEERTDLFHKGLEVVDRATTDCFVVRAGNTVALDRLQALGARRLILVGERLSDPVMQTHLNAGGAAVTTMWRNGEVQFVLFEGTEFLAALPIRVGSSRDGRIKKRRLQTGAMFAVAAAYGLGLSGHTIEVAVQNAPASIPDC